MTTKDKPNADDAILTPSQRAISDTLLKKLVVGEDGSIPTEKKLYEDILPEGLTPDLLKRVQAFYSDATTATTHAVSTLGQDFLKKNKKIEEVHLDKLALGTGAVIRTNYKRQAEVGGIGGAKTVKHGWATTKLSITASGSGAAHFSRVRQHFAEQGTALFG